MTTFKPYRGAAIERKAAAILPPGPERRQILEGRRAVSFMANVQYARPALGHQPPYPAIGRGRVGARRKVTLASMHPFQALRRWARAIPRMGGFNECGTAQRTVTADA
jgi:hypothetical protein